MTYDCIVVGGGAAGLSAALVLGRARRRVLVIDAGEQSNRPAHLIGGLLGQDETSPAEFLALGRRQLAALSSVEFCEGQADIRDDGDQLVVDGQRATHILLATGAEYRTPPLPGLERLWGDTVFHCPFCHGWEAREQPMAVLARDAHGATLARLLRAWTSDVVLLTNGERLDPQAVRAATEAGVAVLHQPVAALADCSRHGACGEHLDAVLFADGSELPRRALLVQVEMIAQADAAALGLAVDSTGRIEVDGLGRTSRAGVWAAGDLVDPMPSVANAIASGSRAATGIVHDLLLDGPAQGDRHSETARTDTQAV